MEFPHQPLIPPRDAPKLLTVPQVARILVVSESWVRQKVKQGELVGYRIGLFLRVPMTELKKFLAKHRAASPGGARGKVVLFPVKRGEEDERRK